MSPEVPADIQNGYDWLSLTMKSVLEAALMVTVPAGVLVSEPEAGLAASQVLPSAFEVLGLSFAVHLLAGKCDFRIPSAPLQ